MASSYHLKIGFGHELYKGQEFLSRYGVHRYQYSIETEFSIDLKLANLPFVTKSYYKINSYLGRPNKKQAIFETAFFHQGTVSLIFGNKILHLLMHIIF
jgi:hypothetical protein